MCSGPGRKQEELRRKIENGVRELWYFVRSEVKKLGHIETGELQKHISMQLQDLGHHQRCFIKHIHKMNAYNLQVQLFEERKHTLLFCHHDSRLWGHAKAKKPLGVVFSFNHTVCTLTLRSIMTDLYYLSQADGAGEWREKEAKDLSDLVQNRITYLQVNLTHMQSLIIQKWFTFRRRLLKTR